MVGHSRLAKRHPSPEVDILLKAYRRLVYEQVDRYGGGEIDWASDGGIFAFWGVERSERAVLAGIHILLALPAFNLDKGRNPFPEPIQIRVAADEGEIEFRWPTSEIASTVLNFVAHLEKNRTRGGEFCISEAVYKNLGERLQASFSHKSRFEDKVIYVFPAVQNIGRVSGEEVARLLATMRTQVSTLSGILDSIGQGNLTAADFEALSGGFDFVYTSVEQFCRWFGSIDEHWSPDYFRTLARYTSELLEEERLFWDVFHRRYVDLSKDDHVTEDLRAILQVGGSRRSLIIAELGLLLGQFRSRSETHQTSSAIFSVHAQEDTVPSDLLAKVEQLIRADDLEEEASFAEVMLCDRQQLSRLLSAEDSMRSALAKSLWALLDLVLIEDASARKDGNLPELFGILLTDPVSGWKFQIVQNLLSGESNPTLEIVTGLARASAKELTPSDYQGILVALLVDHTSERVRAFAVANVEFNRLWRSIAYPKASIRTILSVQKRLKLEEGEDRRKIFFDCIRARVAAAIESTRSDEEMLDLKHLIFGLFNFDFFIQTEYFERLNDLLTRFLKKAEQFRLDISSFTEVLKKLDKERIEKGNPAATLPEGIGGIPPAIQRRLAREGLYLDFFVLHPEDRIARETLSHIKEGTLERVLTYRNINKWLFGQLVRRPEITARRPTLLVVLHHPKCDPGFAMLNFGQLSIGELQAISRDVGGNPEVRKRALLSALHHPGCDMGFAQKHLNPMTRSELEALSRSAKANPEVRRLAAARLGRSN